MEEGFTGSQPSSILTGQAEAAGVDVQAHKDDALSSEGTDQDPFPCIMRSTGTKEGSLMWSICRTTSKVQKKLREGSFLEAVEKGGCRGFILAKFKKTTPMLWPG